MLLNGITGVMKTINITMRLLITAFFLCGLLTTGIAQKHYTDSLKAAIHDPKTSPGNRIMALCDLSDIIRYEDTALAMRWAQEAVTLSHKEPDLLYRVYAYNSRSTVYLRMRNFEATHRDMDTCMLFAEKSKDAKALSFAWYEKGRMLNFENLIKETIDAQLKALKYIRGKGYWKEEAAIYYALYGAFSNWEDLDNQDKYALLALDAAQKSKDPNKLCESWQAISIAAEYRYMQNKNKALLDSALQANKTAISIYLQHEPYMRMEQLIAIPAINTADMYNRHFPPSPAISDSIRQYAALALNHAVKARDINVQAASFGILNEDAQRNGNYAQAETYLLQALSLLIIEPKPNDYLLASVYEGLATVAEKGKDPAKALKHYRSYLQHYKKNFDIKLANSGQELEAKYQAKEKEQQIKFLEETSTLHRNQKYLYIGIAIALLLGLLFLFRAYHFKLRYAMQKERILKQEKEEARLLAKLKAEDALLADLEKQKAELHARLQEEKAARLEAEQQAILTKNETLQKEALANNLHMEQKTKVLQELKSKLDENPGKGINAVELSKLIKQQQHIDDNYEELKTELKEIHPDFYLRLQKKADEKLTPLDLKYCAYIYLKRSTLEIANLAGVEPKSIRMSKYRIKQKLGLGKEDDLDAYIGRMV